MVSRCYLLFADYSENQFGVWLCVSMAETRIRDSFSEPFAWCSVLELTMTMTRRSTTTTTMLRRHSHDERILVYPVRANMGICQLHWWVWLLKLLQSNPKNGSTPPTLPAGTILPIDSVPAWIVKMAEKLLRYWIFISSAWDAALNVAHAEISFDSIKALVLMASANTHNIAERCGREKAKNEVIIQQPLNLTQSVEFSEKWSTGQNFAVSIDRESILAPALSCILQVRKSNYLNQ